MKIRSRVRVAFIIITTLFGLLPVVMWLPKGSLTNITKLLTSSQAGSSSQTDCLRVIQQYLHMPLTDAYLRTIYDSCGDSTSSGAGGVTSAIFTRNTYNNVSCPPIETSFSTSRRPRIALASFPGAGNTWTRHLIEQVTGFWTGSVYTDTVLAKTFRGEIACATSDKIFIIKTHLTTEKLPTCKVGGRNTKVGNETYQHYEAAILLIRNPYDALIAEYHRRRAGHIKAAPKDAFNATSWNKFPNKEVDGWLSHSQYWLTDFPGRVHVVFYEELRANLPYELYRLAEFLGMPVTYQKLWCIMENSEGEFHREKADWANQVRYYTDEMQLYIDKNIKLVEMVLKKKDIGHRDAYQYTQ